MMKTLNQVLMEVLGKDLLKVREDLNAWEIPYTQNRENETGYYLLQVREGMALIPYHHKGEKRLALSVRLMDDRDRDFVKQVQEYWKNASEGLVDCLFVYAQSKGNILVEIRYDDLNKRNPGLLFHEEMPQVYQELKDLGWTDDLLPNKHPLPGGYEYFFQSPRGSKIFGTHSDEERDQVWNDLLELLNRHGVNYIEKELTLADKM